MKMNDSELLSLIRAYEMASLGSSVAAGATISTTVFPSNSAMKTLEIDRYDALNAYFARPLGNEIENRSNIVLPELRDTIEWIMPQLMRMFVSSKSVCRFDAENEADEKQAEMESLVCNAILMQQNNGFFVLHDFFKDAMLMRNGYAKIYWKEETHSGTEKYTGLTEIELTQLLADEDNAEIEVLEQREYKHDVILPIPQIPMQGLPPPQPGAPPQPPPQVSLPISLFDIKIRRTEKKGRVCVTCLPPEEMRVTPRAREGMENLAYAAHITTSTRSDLISDGYDVEWVNSLAAGRPNWMEIDALARNQVVDQLSVEDPADQSMQEIELREVIIRVDYDGDGVAELRRVVVGGDKIGENEEIEETEFASCVPKRMPHRHTGISLYDEIMDLQIIKTNLFRSGLDNLTISNNQRVAVDHKRVNLDDLLTSRPGGVIRGDGNPQEWLMPVQHPSNIVEQVLPVMEYIDQLKTNRTGVGKQMMGVDPDELQDVTKGAQMAAMSAAALKIEQMARLLAEGVKDIFLKIHGALIRHQDKPLEFEISGKWVQVDPSSWRRRTKISPNVGLGSGNREEMRTNLMALGQAQAELKALGLVGPKQAYATFELLCESLGFNNPERFSLDPGSQEDAQQIQHNQQMMAGAQAPQVQVASIKAKVDAQMSQDDTKRVEMKAQSAEQIQAMRVKADQDKANRQMVHEALQQHSDRSHEATQGHRDREVQLDQNHLQIILKLIPAIAQILAAEKASQAELGSDVSQAASSIE